LDTFSSYGAKTANYLEGRVGSDFMSHVNKQHEVLLTPAEVASLFRVDPKTVTRWAKAGKLTAIRTLGGHRRYRQSEVHNLLKSNQFKGV
jgi:excisionase family DNA binding protein